MTESIQPGSTVRLKSGGPLMTVTSIRQGDDGQIVWCAWFDEKDQEFKGKFPMAALKLDNDGPTSTRFTIA